MSRNFIPCLGLVLGAAMIAGTPAQATGTITAAAVPQLAAAMSGTLADRIEELWATSKELADTDIDARMDGSRVILEGQVANASQRQTAERLAKRVKGVTEVDNQITLRVAGASPEGTKGSVLAGDVKDSAKVTADKSEDALEKTGHAVEHAAEATKDAVVAGAHKTKDVVVAAPVKIDETWITSKIASKINADDALEDVDVDVKVKKNVVTISGDVPSAALRDRVLRIARETEGVASVIDNMVVRAGSQP
ncbi:periplasmic protein [Luteitalea pratensis]|uniref:Periplasmic protein n=1 Tax=Luteitalea pratensis TaxID=1855912 RepID=A0A143PRT6_LUTPR|nr:BON domain-containing protein [Luteitalea pratensis]AMY10539.1 periplasmic protein [Luteitalea pratensis]